MGVEIRHLARKCIILENKEKTTILKKAILRISEKSDTRINYNRNLQPSKRLPTLNAAAFYQAILDQYYDKDAVQTFPVSEITKTVFSVFFTMGSEMLMSVWINNNQPFKCPASSRFAASFRGIDRLGSAFMTCDNSDLHISVFK